MLAVKNKKSIIVGIISSLSVFVAVAQPNIDHDKNLLLTNYINVSFRSDSNQINCQEAWQKCGISLFESASFSAHESIRDDGTGSILFSELNDKLETVRVSVTPDSYMFSGFMKVSRWPPSNIIVNARYYGSNGFLRNDKFVRWSSSDEKIWEEFAYIFRPPKRATFVKLTVRLESYSDGVSSSVWIDDLRLSKGVGFARPASNKKPFESSKIKIDSLGNISVLRNGEWGYFFPRCIYADNNRKSWELYAKQGFNCIMRAATSKAVHKAKMAGLMSGFSLNWYIAPSLEKSHPIKMLEARLNALKKSKLTDQLLWYYWDNENETIGEWQTVKNVMDKVRSIDPHHPIYALQGQEGIARKYNNRANLTDIVGAYVGDNSDDEKGSSRGSLGHIILDNIEGQTSPVVVAQINYGVGAEFRPRLYTAIARGARAMGYWKDEFPQAKIAGRVDRQVWWNDFPLIAAEIKQLMPIIREPHWTNWSAVSSESQIEHGTRIHKGQGFLIAANHNAHEIQTTFTIDNLGYKPKVAVNFFNNNETLDIKNSSFSVAIPAFGSMVYFLE